jgi:molybdopterin-guanine dinucleotide biosynthesis protein A
MRHDNITGVILAGGRSVRMGGQDKGLLELKGEPLIKHVINRIQPQVARLLINTNRNFEGYEQFGVQVIMDIWPDYPGPLAGIAAAMAVSETEYILCGPCDTPSLPEDYADRLLRELQDNDAEASVVYTEQGIQPVCALLKCKLQDNLNNYYLSGHRKVRDWLKGLCLVKVDFSDCSDAFVNINTPDELKIHSQQASNKNNYNSTESNSGTSR